MAGGWLVSGCVKSWCCGKPPKWASSCASLQALSKESLDDGNGVDGVDDLDDSDDSEEVDEEELMVVLCCVTNSNGGVIAAEADGCGCAGGGIVISLGMCPS